MAVQDKDQNEHEYENEQTYEQEQVPYEDHIVQTNGDGLLSGIFDAFEEVITKPTVGLVKEVGSDAVELGTEVAAMVRNNAPEMSSHVPEPPPMPSPAADLPVELEIPTPQRYATYDYSPDY